MDLRALFETLVTNDFIPDFPYYRHCFTFKTLFYDSTFAYRMCSCGYQHENLEYITPSGDIDKDMYGKILKCLIDGKCEHVDGQPEDHVAEANIYGIHVAAAVGTEGAVRTYKGYEDYLAMKPVGLFGVHPCVIAMKKNQYNVLGCLLLLPNLIVHQYLLSSQRVDENGLIIRFQRSHLLRHCMGQKNQLLLKRFLRSREDPPHLQNALEFSFKRPLPCTESILLNAIKHLVQKGQFFLCRSSGYFQQAGIIISDTQLVTCMCKQ